MGHFEKLILLAILRRGEDAYGVTIRTEINEHTGREIAPGALYTGLDRLEAKGYVTSRSGDSIPQRGGRSRRYYKVTPVGLAAVRETQSEVRQMLKGLKIEGGLYV